MFRAADALGCKHLYLTGISSVPPNKEIQKTALGATESVSWSYHADLFQLVKELEQSPDNVVVILEQTADSINLRDFQPSPSKHYFIVVGNEVEGVQPELLTGNYPCIEIPQSGIKKSLNVSVAAGICMWHFRNNNQ